MGGISQSNIGLIQNIEIPNEAIESMENEII